MYAHEEVTQEAQLEELVVQYLVGWIEEVEDHLAALTVSIG